LGGGNRISGGLFSNLLMTFYGRPIHQAVATSAALAVLISIPRALGYVSPIGAALVMPTSLLTAGFGVKAAHAMSKRTLETAFGCYLFIVGRHFVISLL
jgi:uncharacterized protein